MNILVTGANGQLGNEMRIVSKNTSDNYIFTDVCEQEGNDTVFLDITDIEAIRKIVKEKDITVIVNCAAYTNVDAAETAEELAEKLGADKVFSIEKYGINSIKKTLQAENGGLGVDLCLEASGAPAAIPVALDILRNRGVYLIPGQYSDSGAVEIHPEVITFKALHIIGSSQYSVCDVKAYLEFMKEHIQLQKTIVKLGTFYHISDVNKAFEDAEAGKNIKTLLTV